MLTSNRTISFLSARHPPGAAHSVGHAAADVGRVPSPAVPACRNMALALPTLATAIPGKFALKSKTNALRAVAVELSKLGVLREEHWKGNVSEAVNAAFSGLADRYMPKPLADFTLLVAESTMEAELEEEHRAYQQEHKLPERTKVSSLILTFNSEELVHRVIGHTLKKLEQQRTGLGQTVFYWLHEGFNETARALDPVDGKGWAEMNYWQGESDETLRLEEEMDWIRRDHEEKMKELPAKKRVPFDEKAARAKIDIFTKADYDLTIPVEFGSKFKRKPVLSLPALKRLLKPELYAAVAAVAKLRTGRTYRKGTNDMGLFEKCQWEMSPYLLRWECSPNRARQDSLAQIYDDYMNSAMECGETMMDVNAVFAWHDTKSLRRAVKNFESYCRLLGASENLLKLIAPKQA